MTDRVLTEGGSEGAEEGGRRRDRKTVKMREGGWAHVNTYK